MTSPWARHASDGLADIQEAAGRIGIVLFHHLKKKSFFRKIPLEQ
jgi:hypothetical protein